MAGEASLVMCFHLSSMLSAKHGVMMNKMGKPRPVKTKLPHIPQRTVASSIDKIAMTHPRMCFNMALIFDGYGSIKFVIVINSLNFSSKDSSVNSYSCGGRAKNESFVSYLAS